MFRDEEKLLEKQNDKTIFYIPLSISSELFSKYKLFKITPQAQREYIYKQLLLYKDFGSIMGATELLFDQYFKYQCLIGIKNLRHVVVSLEVSKEDIQSCNGFISWKNACSIQVDKISIDKIKAIHVYHKLGTTKTGQFHYLIEFDKLHDNSTSCTPSACLLL